MLHEAGSCLSIDGAAEAAGLGEEIEEEICGGLAEGIVLLTQGAHKIGGVFEELVADLDFELLVGFEVVC